MSRLLNALAWVAPGAAVRRAQALATLSVMRSYDGASTGRRAAGLAGRATSANAEIGPALGRLRDRSRDLVRNTTLGARALDVLCSHVVGAGINVRWATGNAALDRRLTAAWRAWARHADVSGVLTFEGLVSLALRSALEGGDSLVRMIPLGSRDQVAGDVPLRLQVLEGDHLDETVVRVGAADRRVVMGVELGPYDRRLGYHLLPVHPGEGVARLSGTQSSFVDVADVCHLYRPLRPGQVRGVPVFAPVLMAARDHADLVEAMIVKAKMEACHGVAITAADAVRARGLAQSDGSFAPAEVGEYRPGMKLLLQPGESVQAINPAGSGSFPEISIQTLMLIASGMMVTYDQLTGDLRQANYSSLRAGKIEFRRLVEQLQWTMLVPMLLDRIVDRWLHYAILSGVIKDRSAGFAREYVMPAVEPIDPRKDLEADILAVRAGRMSPQDFIEGWGRPFEDVLAEHTAFKTLIDEAGLVLDIDPRRTTQAGAAQPATTPVNTEN